MDNYNSLFWFPKATIYMLLFFSYKKQMISLFLYKSPLVSYKHFSFQLPCDFNHAFSYWGEFILYVLLILLLFYALQLISSYSPFIENILLSHTIYLYYSSPLLYPSQFQPPYLSTSSFSLIRKEQAPKR